MIREIFDRETMPGLRAFKQYFSKSDQTTKPDVFKYLYGGFYSTPPNSTAGRPDHLNYAIAARFYTPIKCMLANHRTWLKLGEGIEIAETLYQAEGWDSPIRMVMVRQATDKRPQTAGNNPVCLRTISRA